MTDTPVLLDVSGGIATVTLNRPHAGNAIDLPLARALLDAAVRCETDPAIRCVLLTGAGRLFCAGGDLEVFREAGDRIDAVLSELAGTLHMALNRFARMASPMVVLVNGPAAGAGMSLAIGGDIVLCSASAHFTPAYGSVGLTPDGGMSWTLPRLVGMRRAQEILLLGRRIGAEEAQAIGLVTRTLADTDLAAEARAVCERLAASPGCVNGPVRALLRRSLHSDLADQLAHEEAAIVAAGASTECRQTIARLFEGKPVR